jgi:CDP-diacylglycerol--glycerol-3-phosphate 3-phosphatidyltransferase
MEERKGFQKIRRLLARIAEFMTIGHLLALVVKFVPRWMKPNHISVGRIALVPLVAVLFGYGQNFWATVFLAIAVASDAIDGALAKIRGQKSRLGEWLDPCADKLLVVTLLILDGRLSGWSHFPLEFIVTAVALEGALTAGRPVKSWLGKSSGANRWGKMKMWFQSATVFCLVAGDGWTLAAANLYLGVAVVLAMMSLAGHIRDTCVRRA